MRWLIVVALIAVLVCTMAMAPRPRKVPVSRPPYGRRRVMGSMPGPCFWLYSGPHKATVYHLH